MDISFTVEPPVIDAGDPRSRTALILHGGGGPRTVAPIVEHLAATMHALAPTHPGWEGTPRAESITSVARLASAYLAMLLQREEHDVVLVGSSIGGWIAIEMALQARLNERYAGLIGAVIDIDGVGPSVPGERVVDFFALDARGLAEVAWHNPERGYLDPARLSDEQRAIQRGNAQTMAAVAGPQLSDPQLLPRLSAISVPTLLVWGESDGVVSPGYGRAVTRAIPGAQFALIPEAGHLPHLEAPTPTWEAIDAFLTTARTSTGE